MSGNTNIAAVGGVAMSEELGVAITPKTLTAVSPTIIAALGAGAGAVVFDLGIQNTDTATRSVTISDGTINKGPYEIKAGEMLSVHYWPLVGAWWFGANLAITATPSADGVLKVTHGRYYVSR